VINVEETEHDVTITYTRADGTGSHQRFNKWDLTDKSPKAVDKNAAKALRKLADRIEGATTNV